VIYYLIQENLIKYKDCMEYCKQYLINLQELDYINLIV
jgi:hypothetical protein